MWWLCTALSCKKMMAHSGRSCCWHRTGCTITCSNSVPWALLWSKTVKSLTWKEYDIHHLQSALTVLCNLLVFKMGEYHQALCCFGSGWNECIHNLSIIKMWWRNTSLSLRKYIVTTRCSERIWSRQHSLYSNCSRSGSSNFTHRIMYVHLNTQHMMWPCLLLEHHCGRHLLHDFSWY